MRRERGLPSFCLHIMIINGNRGLQSEMRPTIRSTDASIGKQQKRSEALNGGRER